MSEEFSYKDYLARYGTYAVVRYPKIVKIGAGQGNKIKTALLGIKQRFQNTLSDILPEPHNALAQDDTISTLILALVTSGKTP